ncbi:hypothetical protein BDN72DRAFT_960978 [Pluteus cervinus]|uniref:Uncharacterized protein n=1 Tax=Pluteus cervinus TaxID=181527 RepID=A0ACD3AQ75_9AGAR|nr:hypothetical protein BDN72DRAFT_960978 [Pluteus cervinus]
MLSTRATGLLRGRFPSLAVAGNARLFSASHVGLKAPTTAVPMPLISRRALVTQNQSETGKIPVLPVSQETKPTKNASKAKAEVKSSASTSNLQPRKVLSSTAAGAAPTSPSSPPNNSKAENTVAVPQASAKTNKKAKAQSAQTQNATLKATQPPPKATSPSKQQTSSSQPPASPSSTKKAAVAAATPSQQPKQSKGSSQPPQNSPKVDETKKATGTSKSDNSQKKSSQDRKDPDESKASPPDLEITSSWPRSPLVQTENFFLRNAEELGYDVTSRPPTHEMFLRLEGHSWDWKKLPWVNSDVFVGVNSSLIDPDVRRKRQRLVTEFRHSLCEDCTEVFGEDSDDVNVWQEFFRRLEIDEKPGDLVEYKQAIEKVHINITDLIKTLVDESSPHDFGSLQALKEYTLDPNRKKIFPKKYAINGGLLRRLLRYLFPLQDAVKEKAKKA